MFIINNGFPLMVINGPANMMASSSQLNHVRQRKKRPLTLRGYIHLRGPDWSAVLKWSRKSAGAGGLAFSGIGASFTKMGRMRLGRLIQTGLVPS